VTGGQQRPGASLGEWTWPDVGRRRPILLVPLGSTEQHGPHLPLDTDSRVAVAVCHRVAAVATVGVMVAPALAYGASGEHQGFPGTLSIGREALAAVVTELGRSAGSDYRLVLFVNGHGGNAEALAGAMATLEGEGRPVRSWSPTVRDDSDSHAGRVETSLLLALAPELVRRERAEVGATAPLGELMAQLRTGGLRAVTANGVLGDPAGASAEEGERLLAAWTAELSAAITDAPV